MSIGCIDCGAGVHLGEECADDCPTRDFRRPTAADSLRVDLGLEPGPTLDPEVPRRARELSRRVLVEWMIRTLRADERAEPHLDVEPAGGGLVLKCDGFRFRVKVE